MQPRIVPKYAAGKRPWDIFGMFSEYIGDVVGSVFLGSLTGIFWGLFLGYGVFVLSIVPITPLGQ